MSFLRRSVPAAQLYGEICQQLETLPLRHDPASEVSETYSRLEGISDEELLGANIARRDMVQAVRSGLLLRADLTDESHTISQSISASEGSYWHGIMHRREPDYSNAKYWFRRVGEHPLFTELASSERVRELDESSGGRLLSGSRWDPYHFVDLCEECERSEGSELRSSLEEAQAIEIDLLLEFCFARAIA